MPPSAVLGPAGTGAYDMPLPLPDMGARVQHDALALAHHGVRGANDALYGKTAGLGAANPQAPHAGLYSGAGVVDPKQQLAAQNWAANAALLQQASAAQQLRAQQMRAAGAQAAQRLAAQQQAQQAVVTHAQPTAAATAQRAQQIAAAQRAQALAVSQQQAFAAVQRMQQVQTQAAHAAQQAQQRAAQQAALTPAELHELLLLQQAQGFAGNAAQARTAAHADAANQLPLALAAIAAQGKLSMQQPLVSAALSALTPEQARLLRAICAQEAASRLHTAPTSQPATAMPRNAYTLPTNVNAAHAQAATLSQMQHVQRARQAAAHAQSLRAPSPNAASTAAALGIPLELYAAHAKAAEAARAAAASAPPPGMPVNGKLHTTSLPGGPDAALSGLLASGLVGAAPPANGSPTLNGVYQDVNGDILHMLHAHRRAPTLTPSPPDPGSNGGSVTSEPVHSAVHTAAAAAARGLASPGSATTTFTGPEAGLAAGAATARSASPALSLHSAPTPPRVAFSPPLPAAAVYSLPGAGSDVWGAPRQGTPSATAYDLAAALAPLAKAGSAASAGGSPVDATATATLEERAQKKVESVDAFAAGGFFSLPDNSAALDMLEPLDESGEADADAATGNGDDVDNGARLFAALDLGAGFD